MMKTTRDRVLKNIYKLLCLFTFGGFVYYTIEMIFRGYSHESMYILGGICFVLIGCINEFFSWETLFQYQCLIGAGIVTVLEFITGCIVNLWLGLNVWDYSDMPLNLLGQICLPFSVIWIVLSAVAIFVDDVMRYYLFDEEEPRYKFKK